MQSLVNAPSQEIGGAMESLLIDGDLSRLNPEQRVVYYKKTCESLKLNYLTKPFAYIRLNGQLRLYPLKDCTEQLRQRDGVSIYKLDQQMHENVYVVTAYARNINGKEDVATGVVSIMGLKGDALANALMKAETKAKRRVTLSICGLGMTDETEIETIPNAQKVDVNMDTGEINEPLQIGHAAPDHTVLEQGLAAINDAKTMDDLKQSYLETLASCQTKEQKEMVVKRKDIRKEYLTLQAQSPQDYAKDME